MNSLFLTFKQFNSVRDQIFIVQSADDVRSTWSIGENLTHQTLLRCPRNTPNNCKLLASQSWKLNSEWNIEILLEKIDFLLLKTSTLAVLSKAAVAMNLSFGEMETQLISASWAFTEKIAFRVTASVECGKKIIFYSTDFCWKLIYCTLTVSD